MTYHQMTKFQLKKYNELKEYAENKGFELISDLYINAATYVEVKCPNNHTRQVTPANFKDKKSKYGCRTCASDSQRGSISICHKAAEEKNGKCLSTEYKTVDTKYEWECEYGHIWTASLYHVQKCTWCPKCRGNTKFTIDDCKQFAEERNGKCLSIEYIDAREQMTWECEHGHIWEYSWSYIRSATVWCQQCNGNVAYTIDDCKKHAEKKNGKCLSDVYIPKEKQEWECEFKHVWRSMFNSIKTKNSWCPECTGNKKICIDDCKNHAEKKNGKCLSVEYVAKEKQEWECKYGHQWKAKFNNIKNKDHWCPACAGNKKMSIDDCHKIAKKNKGICLSIEYKNTDTKYEWKCKQGHQWSASLDQIKNRHTWCPYCAGVGKYTIEDCQKIAKERGGKCLSLIYKNSKEKMLWECKYGHIWATVFGCLNLQNTWCPTCAGCIKHTLEKCQEFAKTLGGKCLSKTYTNANKRLRWKCKYNHKWKARFNNVKNQKNWCPECADTTLTIEECQEFAKNLEGRCLSKIYENSHEAMEWECSNKHQWVTKFSHIKNDRTWCPQCRNKTEAKFYEWYNYNSNIIFHITSQVKYDWCINPKTGYSLRFDFVIEDLKLIIEIDGRQHFIQVRDWTSPEDQQESDIYKMKFALINGYSIIRIFQEDMWNDSYDWKTDIASHIKLNINPTITYLAKDKSMYNIYATQFQV